MNIVFQVGKAGIWEKLICLWTRSNIYHSGLLFSSGLLYDITGSHNSGFHDVVLSDKNWLYVNIPMTLDQELHILQFCSDEVNCKYDWVGLFKSQIFNMHRQDPSKWFCSELVMAALQSIGMYKGLDPCSFSPAALYNLLTATYPDVRTIVKDLQKKM